MAEGFEALADTGPTALKAEPLARRLGTTKGSFYWHFRDVPDYRDALLDEWTAQITACLDVDASEEGSPVSRLRRMAQSMADNAAGPAAPVEPAIRAWGRENATAARHVAAIDARRAAHIGALLREVGIRNPEMARLVHAAGIGMSVLAVSGPDDNARAMGSLVDLILALRE